MRHLASFLLALPLLVSAAAAGRVELAADESGHYVTQAEIDGTALPAVIDTGASQVALPYEAAEEAGLRPHALTFDAPVSTANGVVKAARVTLRRVDVDGVRVRDVPGLVLPEGALSVTLIGMSFLSRLDAFRIEDGVLILED